jgi:hypothetical protein
MPGHQQQFQTQPPMMQNGMSMIFLNLFFSNKHIYIHFRSTHNVTTLSKSTTTTNI